VAFIVVDSVTSEGNRKTLCSVVWAENLSNGRDASLKLCNLHFRALGAEEVEPNGVLLLRD
jgi:hypothetical protein